MDELSLEERKVVEDLFIAQSKSESTLARDTFRYRISRETSKGIESIEVDEEKIPGTVRQCVRDEIV